MGIELYLSSKASSLFIIMPRCASAFALQRCRMNVDTGAEYLTPWHLSECVDGGGVGVVESSHCSACSEGDVVTSFNWPWQTHAVMKGSVLEKVWHNALGLSFFLQGTSS